MDAVSVYLLKPIARRQDALDPRKRLVRYEVRDGRELVGELYVAQGAPETPRWLRYFEGAVQPLPSLSNQTASAVLLMNRGEHLFAIPFGYGRHFLRSGAWVEGFGLRVTLNSIDPASIRSLERKTFDALSRLTRTQTAREGTAAELGVDSEQDLLRAITGRSTDARLGSRVTGGDALVVAAPARVHELPARLAHFHARYREKRYRESFAWVDHIAAVKDPRTIAALDEAVVARLRAGDTRGVTLAPPELVDWNVVRGFRFRERGDVHADITLDAFLESLGSRATLRASTLRSRRMYAVDDAGTAVDAWPVDRCVSCELEVDGGTFVRSTGRWYRVERGLVSQVNAAVAALVRSMPELPPYDDANEGSYNARVARTRRGMVLVDKKLLVHGGGASRIEFCDLLSEQKQMIHVKRYCGSQTLSHLFAQGLVGVNLLLNDREFRGKLDAVLPRSHRVGSSRPDAREYELVYAIVEGSGRPLVEALPFFSRLTLRNAARQVAGFGCRVGVTMPASRIAAV